jgi:hypothetical protein
MPAPLAGAAAAAAARLIAKKLATKTVKKQVFSTGKENAVLLELTQKLMIQIQKG